MKPSKPWTDWRGISALASRKPRQQPIFAEALKSRLPLIERWGTGVDLTKPAALEPDCRRCACTHEKRCLPMVGEGQGALIVTPAVTAQEQAAGKLMIGPLAVYVEQVVSKYATGRVAFTSATKCAAKAEGAMESCRPFLAHDIDTCNPERIVAFGAAGKALTGHYVDARGTRRAWTVVRGKTVLLVMDPKEAMHNRFVKKWFEADMRWALTTPLPTQLDGETRVLTTGAEVEQYLAEIRCQPSLPVSVDVEHAGFLWNDKFRLLCVGLCQDPTRPVVCTMPALEEAREAFTNWLASPTCLKVNQNIKHDRHALYRHFGVDIAGIAGDTMLWARMRESEAPAGLGKLAWLVGYGGYKEAAHGQADDEKGGPLDFSAIAPNDLHAYNGRDVSVTVQVYNWQRERMGQLLDTWHNIIGPGFDALAVVERNGMLLSEDAVRAYDRWLEAKEDSISTQVHAFSEVPSDFTGTNAQVADLLFDRLRLPARVKTKTGKNSVGADALEDLVEAHPLVPLILAQAKVKKQRSTYGLGALENISPLDGRVHTTFRLVRTGRLSSSDPNMQNITRPDPDKPGSEGEWARGCYVAPPGHKFVNLDFCMGVGTLIDTPCGPTPIEAMKPGDMVFTYNHKTEKPDCSKVVDARFTGYKPTIVVCLDNGQRIRCTSEHRFIALNGEEVRAGLLKPGQRLLPLRRSHAGPKKYETLYAHSAFRYSYTHQVVGWAKTGLEVRPAGMVIHHRDEDAANNDPENLAAIPAHEHRAQHGRKNAKEQWARPGMRKKMSVGVSKSIKARGGYGGENNPNFGNRHGVEQTCAKCGKVFYRPPSRGGRFCSPACYKLSRNHVVVEVIADGLLVPTYELEVGRDHNYALAAGVFVHNSQLELRVAAMLSGDEAMAEAFRAGKDFHQATAALAFNMPFEQVKKAQRSAAKAVNFGLLFGKSEHSLGQDLGITTREALEIVEKVFGAFPDLARWRRKQIATAETTGDLWTHWGGWHHYRGVQAIGDTGHSKESERTRKHWRNVALNTPIQNVATWFCLASVVEAVRWTLEERPEVKVVMTVHDSIVLEAPDELVEETAKMVSSIMLSWPSGNVPLAVDVEVGEDWGRMLRLKSCADVG